MIKFSLIYSIALVRTVQNIHDFARRIIALTRYPPAAGRAVTVSGWGYTAVSGSQGTSPSQLQFLEKRLIGESTCRDRVGSSHSTTICTESPAGQGR